MCALQARTATARRRATPLAHVAAQGRVDHVLLVGARAQRGGRLALLAPIIARLVARGRRANQPWSTSGNALRSISRIKSASNELSASSSVANAAKASTKTPTCASVPGRKARRRPTPGIALSQRSLRSQRARLCGSSGWSFCCEGESTWLLLADRRPTCKTHRKKGFAFHANPLFFFMPPRQGGANFIRARLILPSRLVSYRKICQTHLTPRPHPVAQIATRGMRMVLIGVYLVS